MNQNTTKTELLILLYSLEALHETNNQSKALEVIKKVIGQIENEPKKISDK